MIFSIIVVKSNSGMETAPLVSKEEVLKGIEFLKKEYEYFNDENVRLELEDEDDPQSPENVLVHYPGDDDSDYINYSFDEFGYLIAELENLKIINKGRFKTTYKSYQVAWTQSEEIQYQILNEHDFEHTFSLGTLTVEVGLDILRFVLMKYKSFHKEFGTFHHSYPLIVINYEDKREQLLLKEEDNLISSYLFEISDSTGFDISLGKLKIFDEDLEETIWNWEPESEGKTPFKLKPLIPANEGTHLFVAALQVNDPTLKFLNFYKIIEYFAPTIVATDGYNLMASKLDNPKALDPDKEFIESIFKLVSTVNEQRKDAELPKHVLRSIDIVDSIGLLPSWVTKRVKGIVKHQGEIDYDMPKEHFAASINIIASILYSTRNWVVHAKSNYELSGNECPSDDLDQLNIFMREVTAKLIRWYNKLPKHQK